MLGRNIVTLAINEIIGDVKFDTEKLGAGQYLVTMRENGQVVKTANLLVVH